MFIRKDSRIFGTLLFLLRGAFAEIRTYSSIFVRRDKRIFGPFFGRARIGGDEAYPALYLADGLR